MPEPRRPLTGTTVIEWVDGADPDDATQPPNFGYSVKGDLLLDTQRLVALLRFVADSLEAEETD